MSFIIRLHTTILLLIHVSFFSFYNQHSSFTHSGLEVDPTKDDGLVIGQKNIHDKIQQMNFRDCHAKISHVDAQATLGDGVVVQVFGELSNDGHQMRRFTQTFVLACQSPKKYYVHNDIFRYHDVYSEEDEPREDHEIPESAGPTQNNTDGTATMIVQPTVYYPPPPANVIAVSNPPPPQLVTAYTVPVAAAPQQVNGVIHEEMLKNMATQTTQAPQILPPAVPAPPQQVIAMPIAPAATALPIPVEPVAVVVADITPIQTPPNVGVVMVNDANQYDADQSNGEESDTLDNSKETDITSSEEAGK